MNIEREHVEFVTIYFDPDRPDEREALSLVGAYAGTIAAALRAKDVDLPASFVDTLRQLEELS